MDKNTIIRTITALVVAVLDMLKVFGIEIGTDTDAIYGVVSLVVAVWIWWKNNNFSVEAKTAQKLINELKANRHKVADNANPEEGVE